VFLGHGEFRRQRSSGCRRRRHLDQGEAPARTAFRSASHAIRRSSVYRGIRLAGIGWDSFACRGARHGRGVHALCAGLLPFLLPLSVLLFEPNAKSRSRMLPFLVLGGATTLYILWALTAFPLQLYVRGNSIVYINQATNNTAVAVLYVIATCGSLFFSKIKMMVIFGAANLAILLVVMEVKRYAFTSLWCAYAAVASVIILAACPHRACNQFPDQPNQIPAPIVASLYRCGHRADTVRQILTGTHCKLLKRW
jgi:hypothetical protein